MMKANKDFTSDLQKDIIELRGLSKNNLFPKKINYTTNGRKNLLRFLNWNEEFVVFCDCDTDGLCGAAIAKMYFDEEESNHTIHYKVASRSRRGFQAEDVIEIMRDYPSATGIFTIDCGIVATNAAEVCHRNLIDLFITDHHNPGEVLPNAVIINPKLDNYSGFKDFCGAGIIYLLMKETFGKKEGAIQYAAIATIADMVPLISDNRFIVQTGLKEIRNPRKKHKNINNFFAGINAFVLNEKDIGWTIGPTINSASRLGHEDIALKALVMNEDESIKNLFAINQERKDIVKLVYDSGKEFAQVGENSVTMDLGNSHLTGIIGLIAMKLHIDFGLPAMAYANSEGRTHFSIRAPKTTDFIDRVREMYPEISGGGHDEAGGFSTENGSLDIASEFHYFYANRYEQSYEHKYDINISFDSICLFYNDLDDLRPFGIGFEEPTFVSNVLLVDNGLTRNKKHKKYKVYQDTMSSDGAHYIDLDKKVQEPGYYQISYKISYNIYLKGPQIEIIEMNKVK